MAPRFRPKHLRSLGSASSCLCACFAKAVLMLIGLVQLSETLRFQEEEALNVEEHISTACEWDISTSEVIVQERQGRFLKAATFNGQVVDIENCDNGQLKVKKIGTAVVSCVTSRETVTEHGWSFGGAVTLQDNAQFVEGCDPPRAMPPTPAGSACEWDISTSEVIVQERQGRFLKAATFMGQVVDIDHCDNGQLKVKKIGTAVVSCVTSRETVTAHGWSFGGAVTLQVNAQFVEGCDPPRAMLTTTAAPSVQESALSSQAIPPLREDPDFKKYFDVWDAKKLALGCAGDDGKIVDCDADTESGKNRAKVRSMGCDDCAKEVAIDAIRADDKDESVLDLPRDKPLPLIKHPQYGKYFKSMEIKIRMGAMRRVTPEQVKQEVITTMKLSNSELDPHVLDMDPQSPARAVDFGAAKSGIGVGFEFKEHLGEGYEQQARIKKECQRLEENMADPSREKYAQDARREIKEKWTKPCHTNIAVEFLKTASLADSFANITDPSSTLLAFDLDGTLDWMKEHDTANTLQFLADGAAASEKVVVTAAEPIKEQCETILQQLNRQADLDPRNTFKDLLEVAPAQSCKMKDVLRADGSKVQYTKHVGGDAKVVEIMHNKQMALAPGLAMNKYEKAEGLVSYLQKDIRRELFNGQERPNPHDIIFYDDYVSNVVNFADHLCFKEAPPGLQKVTAVWYATPEAKQREDALKAVLVGEVAKGEDCSFDPETVPKEGSYFHPDVSQNTQLSSHRAMFNVV